MSRRAKRNRPIRAYARPTGVDVACQLNAKEVTKNLLTHNIVSLKSTRGGVPIITTDGTMSDRPLGVIITPPTRPAKKVTHVNCMVAVAGLVSCPFEGSQDKDDIKMQRALTQLGHTKLISTSKQKKDILLHGCGPRAKIFNPTPNSLSSSILTRIKYTPLASPNNFDVVCCVSREEFRNGDEIFPGDIMLQVHISKTHLIEVVSLRSLGARHIPRDARIIGVSLTHAKPKRGYTLKKKQALMRIPVRIGGCVTLNETNKLLGQNWVIGQEYRCRHFFMRVLGWKRKDMNGDYIGGLVAHIGTLPLRRDGHRVPVTRAARAARAAPAAPATEDDGGRPPDMSIYNREERDVIHFDDFEGSGEDIEGGGEEGEYDY